MKLLFQEQLIEYDQAPSTEEVIEKINNLLQNKFYFSHLLADGKEILEEPERFLTINIMNIKSLEVIAIAAKEFINDLLLSAEEYTGRSIPLIKTLVDDFYNNPIRENWQELAELFEGIQWLLSMIHTVDQSTERPVNWDEALATSTALQEELENLEEALENEDTVLVADMLQYEILPMLEATHVEVQKAIDSEGIRPHLI